MSDTTTDRPPIVDLVGDARERAIPALKESFTGIYRWHAKRTLREIPTVRAIERDGEIVGAALLEMLAPEVGYVYYLFVASGSRRRGIGAALLDDALERFVRANAVVAYAACEEENDRSLALFRSRGFREVGRDERGFRDGGLGAWGFRRRMWLVSGEVLLGRRLDGPTPAPVPVRGPAPSRGARRSDGGG